MKIETLDHVALWVRDRDTLADFVTTHVGMHVIERNDRFTLVGSNARRGKLTLFAAEGERERGQLTRVGLRVNDLEGALSLLPGSVPVVRNRNLAVFEAPEQLGLGLVQSETDVDYDIDHVAFRVRRPRETHRELAQLGFVVEDGRLRAGHSYIELEAGKPGEPKHPLLNHLGLRVESADEHIAEAESRGLEIDDIVDGPNTYAVFVWGPDRIRLEYVEHKPTFSLV